MSPQLQSLLTNIGALVLIVCLLFVVVDVRNNFPELIAVWSVTPPNERQTAAVGTNIQTSPQGISSSTAQSALKKHTSATTTVVSTAIPTQKKKASPPKSSSVQTDSSTSTKVMRIQNPYSFAPESFDTVNSVARAALVNILCMPQGGALRPISGSGVIIDPRGVILTNAHVAQYVLLSERSQLGIRCVIRTGSPAIARWSAAVLYIPPAWVSEHASDISLLHPRGTGEHDYALLLITSSLDGSPLLSYTGGFPSVMTDTREGIAFLDDQILAASYPAEFIGGLAAQNDLYSASSITTVKQLLTFDTGTIDLLSLGGIIEAQSGSSGGAVLNAWGRLVGVITTTSEGNTTADRDLRAVTLNYIDRDIRAQSGYDLAGILGGNVAVETLDFTANAAPSLIDLIVTQIKG